MTLDEFMALPVMSSQFPVEFEPGKIWEKMTGFCAACGAELPEEAFRGHVKGSFENTFSVSAWGICPCNGKLTQFSYRLRSDMTMSTDS